jgi:hypothetical protein
MKFFTIITLLLIAIAITNVSAQTCSLITTYSPNVCLFNPQQQLDFIDQTGPSDLCKNVNIDPFANGGLTTADKRTICNGFIREDGNSCIDLYAKFLCSSYCTLCLKDPCKSFCDTIASTCPKASANGCFSIMPPCASDNTACTNWNVDTSKLPAPIATTTTKVTTTTTKAGTTTKATTTTTTSHTASPSWVIVPGHFILLTIVLLNMML